MKVDSKLKLEFVGGPGAGKSALSAHLVSMVLSKDTHPELRVYSLLDLQPSWLVNLRKIAEASRFVVSNPAVGRRIVGVVLGSGQSSGRDGITKTVNLLAELRRASLPGPSISEQGVLQAIGSLRVRAERPVTAELTDLCHQWLPTTVVHVVVDREEQIRRLRLRPNGRSRTGSAERLARIDTHLEELLLDWQAMGDAHRLTMVHNRRDAAPADVLRPLLVYDYPFLERSTA